MRLTALLSLSVTWIEMKYFLGLSGVRSLYQIAFSDGEDRDEGESGEDEEEGDCVDVGSGVSWYAGAGVEIVEHQTVGTCWVGNVGTGAGTGLPVPVPAPAQAVVPLVMVVTHTPTLERQELLVASTALLRQVAAAPTACVLLHLQDPTESLRHPLRDGGGGQEAGDPPGGGLQGQAGVVVVAAGAHAAGHLQVGGGQQGGQGGLPLSSHLHNHPPGGAGVGAVAPQNVL